jgi:hypothetical protein
MQAPLAKTTFWQTARLAVRTLAAFAGLVVGWGLAISFVTASIISPEPPFTSVADLSGAVLFVWLSLVLPSLVVPGIHTLLVHEIAARVGERHTRVGSVATALAAGSVLLLDDGLRRSVGVWGLPVALVLSLYGWYRGGMVATVDRGNRVDRVLERIGLATTAALLTGFVLFLAYAWVRALSGGW